MRAPPTPDILAKLPLFWAECGPRRHLTRQHMRAATLTIRSPGPIIEVEVSSPPPNTGLRGLVTGDSVTGLIFQTDGDDDGDGVFVLDLTGDLSGDAMVTLTILDEGDVYTEAIPFLVDGSTTPVTSTVITYTGAPRGRTVCYGLCATAGLCAPRPDCVLQQRRGRCIPAGLACLAGLCVHGNQHHVGMCVLQQRQGLSTGVCVVSRWHRR